MKWINSVVVILSTTALVNSSDRPVPLTNQCVDSDKARFAVWEHKNYATLFKRQIASFEIMNSPARRRHKKKFFVEPLPNVPLLPITEVDRY